MKKKIIILLSALALTAQIVPCALADGDAQKVTIAKDETTLNLTIGDTQAMRDIIYNGSTYSYKNPLEIAPQIINDSTYIPLSDVAKAFALNITWDGHNREVHIAQYKKGDLTPLIEFGIISDDDLNITTQEALNTIKNFQHYAIDDFKNLYVYDYLKSFDNISDESKILLSVLDYLGKHNGCIQKSIATGCQIEPATLTGILSTHGRKKAYYTSNKGRKQAFFICVFDR